MDTLKADPALPARCGKLPFEGGPDSSKAYSVEPAGIDIFGSRACNDEIDPASLTAASAFLVKGDTRIAMSVAPSPHLAGKYTLKPAAWLEGGSTYALKLAGLKDKDGARFDTLAWTLRAGPDPRVPPCLKNLMLDFGTMVGDNTGDFDLGLSTAGFATFIPDSGAILNFFPRAGVPVRSPIKGVVVNIMDQPEVSDHEIHLQVFKGSWWYVTIDHVAALTVKIGDTVSVGQILGKAPASPPGSQRGLVELQMNYGKWANDNSGWEISSILCAMRNLDPEVAGHFGGLVAKLMDRIEARDNNPALFNQSAYSYAACRTYENVQSPPRLTAPEYQPRWDRHCKE